jgi:hypothetical protein
VVEKKNRKKEVEERKFQLKPEDVEAAKNFLNAMGSVFAMSASMVDLSNFDSKLEPAVYYPEKGRNIYIGLKLELPDEDTAKYMMKCFEEAAKS